MGIYGIKKPTAKKSHESSSKKYLKELNIMSRRQTSLIAFLAKKDMKNISVHTIYSTSKSKIINTLYQHPCVTKSIE